MGIDLFEIKICEIYPKGFTHMNQNKNRAIPEQSIYLFCIYPCWNMQKDRCPTRRGKYILNTRQATLMQFPSSNLPLMESVICSFWCRDACVTKRPLNHFESSRPKTWEAQALTAIVAQITRAAPIWALQHNCLFSKQKIPCSANRFRFRPSALWAGNPIEIKRELVNYMAVLYAK